MKQIVERKKLSNLAGVGLVIGIMAALWVLNLLTGTLLAKLTGYNIANVIFWILGFGVAYWLLKTFIQGYVYQMNEDILALSRSYGKRERLIETIYLNKLLFVGDPSEAAKRYPKAKKISAVLSGKGEIPVSAVVYQTVDGTRMALLQANAEFKAKLLEKVRK